MNAEFSVVQAVLIDLRFDKNRSYVSHSIMDEHYSIEKYGLPIVKVQSFTILIHNRNPRKGSGYCIYQQV